MNEKAENLFAIHNTSARNLNKTLDLGGFPCPSIAIVNDATGHTGYGKISVIFPMETVDPRDPDNYVYSRDAWTAVTPIIECEVNDEKLSALKEECRAKIPEKFFSHFSNHWGKFDAYCIEQKVENVDGVEEIFEKNPFMQMLYLTSHRAVKKFPRFGARKRKKYERLLPLQKRL